MASFINSIERFVELHKNLIDAAKTTKDMRKEKATLGKEILEYMVQHNIKDHVVDDFEIINVEREVKAKLTLETIEAMLEAVVNETLDQEKIDSIVSAISAAETTGETKNALSIKKKKQPKERKSKKSSDNDDE